MYNHADSSFLNEMSDIVRCMCEQPTGMAIQRYVEHSEDWFIDHTLGTEQRHIWRYIADRTFEHQMHVSSAVFGALVVSADICKAHRRAYDRYLLLSHMAATEGLPVQVLAERVSEFTVDDGYSGWLVELLELSLASLREAMVMLNDEEIACSTVYDSLFTAPAGGHVYEVRTTWVPRGTEGGTGDGTLYLFINTSAPEITLEFPVVDGELLYSRQFSQLSETKKYLTQKCCRACCDAHVKQVEPGEQTRAQQIFHNTCLQLARSAKPSDGSIHSGPQTDDSSSDSSSDSKQGAVEATRILHQVTKDHLCGLYTAKEIARAYNSVVTTDKSLAFDGDLLLGALVVALQASDSGIGAELI